MAEEMSLYSRIDKIERDTQEIAKLLKLSLFTAGGSLPVTLIGNIFIGDNIGTTDRYVELYRNNFKRLIAIKVTAEFNIPGQTASISLTTDRSNQGRVSLLASGGLVTSETIWVKPDQIIYINTADTTFTLNGSVFRTLIFDPLAFAGFLGGGV